jgi:mono/diheme cytochrome c family protein
MRLMRVMSAAVLVGLGAGPALAQDAKQIERGKAVYEAQKCALCHAIAGKGNAKGPLDSVGSKLSAEDIRKWIVSPKEMKSATNRKPEMRAYPTLPAADLEALVAYMRSLKGA